jgi:hypothetical protein
LVSYSVAFAIKQSPWPWLRGPKPSRTEALTDIERYYPYVTRFGETSGDRVYGPVPGKVLGNERLIWIAVTVAAGGTAIAVLAGHPALSFAPLLGLVGALLAGWTWWRIFRTFLGLLRDTSVFAARTA